MHAHFCFHFKFCCFSYSLAHQCIVASDLFINDNLDANNNDLLLTDAVLCTYWLSYLDLGWSQTLMFVRVKTRRLIKRYFITMYSSDKIESFWRSGLSSTPCLQIALTFNFIPRVACYRGSKHHTMVFYNVSIIRWPFYVYSSKQPFNVAKAMHVMRMNQHIALT